MRINVDLFNSSFRNRVSGGQIIANPVNERIYSPPKIRKRKIKNILCLKYFWNRLLFLPESFTHPPQTPINNIWLEETGISEVRLVRSVLAEKLGLPYNSTKLYIALEESHKIYHEDFPGDFVLEFKGERLGMAILDICYNINQVASPIYRFNPEMKNFKGLF